MVTVPVTAWQPPVALAHYRATLHRIADWYDAQDCFDRPSLQRADVRAADQACQTAWDAQIWPRLAAALATYEHAITGRLRG